MRQALLTSLAPFRWPLALTALGLVLAFVLGWQDGAGRGAALGHAVEFLILAAVLAVLEISLSFDNAIVNAQTLRRMSPLWQHRFLTWGIIIAVFGMRIVFPLAIVVVAAGIGPWEALRLAATRPDDYARIISDAQVGIAGFGGAFLMMVALSYFVDRDKEVHWIRPLEGGLSACARLRGLKVLITGVLAFAFAVMMRPDPQMEFLIAVGAGLATYVAVDLLGRLLDRVAQAQAAAGGLAKAGFGAFLYLEVLDASFSFDGVIGAFALTHNLFLIAIGLGIGALFVRSFTILLVERGTLAEFRYLEHGAFWSVLILAGVMFAETRWHIPEVIAGLLGASFIGLSLLSSIRYRRASR